MNKINIKEIKELVKVISESGLSAIEISDSEGKIRLERNCMQPQNVIQNTAPLSLETSQKPSISTDSKSDNVVDFNNLHEIKAPMIGVFYRAPAENDPPFVKVGDKIKKGDTLCIIEAMKMMNEITAEVEGEIVDICVENAEVVEYSQVLFKVY